MKDIPEKFVKNFDSVGNNTFTQIRREGNVYMYRRTRMDGTFKSYEVFMAKFIKKGTTLPGGMVEKEDRFQYPGSASFGKTAYDCRTETDADKRFEELLKKSKLAQESLEEAKITGKRNKGRRAKTKVEVKLPSGKFTMKMLIANTGLSQPVLYLIVKQWLADNRIKVDSLQKTEGQRGRPQVIYTTV